MRREIAMLRSGPQDELAEAIGRLAVLHIAMGDLREAEKNELEALRIREGAGDPVGTALTWNDLAEVYIKEKQFKKALEYAEKATPVLADNPKVDVADRIAVRQTLGLALCGLKQCGQAIQLLKDALQLEKTNYGADSLFVGAGNFLLGYTYWQNGDMNEAAGSDGAGNSPDEGRPGLGSCDLSKRGAPVCAVSAAKRTDGAGGGSGARDQDGECGGGCAESSADCERLRGRRYAIAESRELAEDAEDRFGVGFGGEVAADFFGDGGADYGGEGVGVGLADAADAAEVFQQALAGARADAGDGVQFGVAVAHLAALAVVGDGEAVGFVADLLDEVQHGRAAVEDDGVGLLAVDVDDLFALGDGGERLAVGDAEAASASAAA